MASALSPGDAGLGTARGAIQIDVRDLRSVQAVSRDVGITVERNLGQINAAAARTQTSLRGLTGVVSQMAAAFGISLGAGTIVQLGRMAVEAEAVATAYRRQRVAALELAGSQTKLNQLLEAYQRATGGAIDRATALADVTRLQAVGFGDTAAELERFVTAARGISIATGQQQDYVIQQLQLAIANQSTMRLDQLGLGVAEVKQRVAELRAENRGLTAEMAYQQAVLGIAEQKFGALARSQEGQATGTERAGRAWADARLKLGELVAFPVGVAGAAIADWFDTQIAKTNAWIAAIQGVGRALGLLPGQLSPTLGSRTGLGVAQREGIPTLAAAPRPAEQIEAIRAWSRAAADIERDAYNSRLDATRQYEQQRSQVIAEYELGIARDAADYARQRARAAAQLESDIADVLREGAAQRTEWEAELGERIAEAREAANERLAEMDADYQRDRERAAGTHRENLLNAAARLDAAAVVAEQRRYAKESRDRDENYREQRGDVEEQLQERIDQEREAHAERLDDARKADEERIADLRTNYEEQRRLEDEDRAIQLQRQAEDHTRQLAEMDRAQGERLAQIDRQASREREQLDAAHLEQLNDLGLYYDGWQKIQDAQQKASLKSFDEWWAEMGKRFAVQGPPQQPTTPAGPQFPIRSITGGFADGGPVHRTGAALVHAGEYVLNPATAQMLRDAMGGLSQTALVAAVRGGGMGGNSSRSVTIEAGAITVYGAAGQSEERLGQIVRAELIAALQAAG